MGDRKRSKKMTLLAASAAGLLAIGMAVANAGVVYAEGVHCAGVNACKGEGWVTQATDADCLKAGGTVLPQEPAAEAPAPAAPQPIQ